MRTVSRCPWQECTLWFLDMISLDILNLCSFQAQALIPTQFIAFSLWLFYTSWASVWFGVIEWHCVCCGCFIGRLRFCRLYEEKGNDPSHAYLVDYAHMSPIRDKESIHVWNCVSDEDTWVCVEHSSAEQWCQRHILKERRMCVSRELQCTTAGSAILTTRWVLDVTRNPVRCWVSL